MHAERCPVCGGSGAIALFSQAQALRACHGCQERGWVLIPDPGDQAKAEAATRVYAQLQAVPAPAPVQASHPTPPEHAEPVDAPTPPESTRVVMSRALVERLLHDGRLAFADVGGERVVIGIGWGTFYIEGKADRG